jgi:hypothetical protein
MNAALVIIVYNVPIDVRLYKALHCVNTELMSQLLSISPMVTLGNNNCSQMPRNNSNYYSLWRWKGPTTIKYDLDICCGADVLTRTIAVGLDGAVKYIKDATNGYSLSYRTDEHGQCRRIVSYYNDLICNAPYQQMRFDPIIYCRMEALAAMFMSLDTCMSCAHIISLTYNRAGEYVTFKKRGLGVITCVVVGQNNIRCEQSNKYWHIPGDVAAAYADIGIFNHYADKPISDRKEWLY